MFFLAVSQLSVAVIKTIYQFTGGKGWAPVAHACNPSFSGGRDQKDHDSKPAQAKSSRDPISKKTITKKGW
jgi:hypothetical protein